MAKGRPYLVRDERYIVVRVDDKRLVVIDRESGEGVFRLDVFTKEEVLEKIRKRYGEKAAEYAKELIG